ncbi:DUF1259 domain-containing protein [Gracilibacillus dipsosauri]
MSYCQTIPIRTEFSLGRWVTFKQIENQTMGMSDLVLRDDEVRAMP